MKDHRTYKGFTIRLPHHGRDNSKATIRVLQISQQAEQIRALAKAFEERTGRASRTTAMSCQVS